MAVQAPTPPTPPVVPKVVLREGGSVHESNAPPPDGTRSTTGEAQAEAQARQSVAEGNGALSKSVQSSPKQEAARAAQAARDASAQTAQGVQQGAAYAQPELPAATQAREAQTAGQQPLTQARPPAPEAAQGHGALYWGATFAALALFAFALLWTFMRRRGRPGELSKADIDDDGIESLTGRELQGMKPDEVLARLKGRQQLAEKRREVYAQAHTVMQEAARVQAAVIAAAKQAKESREEETARAAQEALHAAARPPARSAEPPKATGSFQGARQIARQYREQAVAEPPEDAPEPEPLPQPVRRDDDDDDYGEGPRFEVRI